MIAHALGRCSIQHVGKQRNGKPRFWCVVHQANATGRYGARLDACEGSYLDRGDARKLLRLTSGQYAGGVAMWGAVRPAYDTSGLPPETGIHVHARGERDGDKEIDDTFDAVAVSLSKDLLEASETILTSETAVNFYLSRFLNRDIRTLHCSFCGEAHLDSGYFAVKPHRRHLCHGCGHYFNDTGKAVSNPIASLQHSLRAGSKGAIPVRAPRSLDIRQADYPGGIQVWASNPALVWTSEKPEEEGLHVHLFSAPGQIVIDDTFDRVIIDGVELNESHVQYFMAQGALPHLANKVVALNCPRCDVPHFDKGDRAIFPHRSHECESCKSVFTSPGKRLLVSNPFVAVSKQLISNLTSNNANRSSS